MSKVSICNEDTQLTPNFRPGKAPAIHSLNYYFMGVDGGASKTVAVITDGSGSIIAEGHGGPANPARVGVEEAMNSIEQAVTEACSGARISPDGIAAACIALAGVGDTARYHAMKRAITHELGIANTDLVTDARAALEGALDGYPGVVVIAGTGSIAMGVNDTADQARSGGWGPTLGDEGSGYDIARQALKAVSASFDGRAPRTVLSDSVCCRLGIRTPAELPAAIYKRDLEHADIAALAELVCEAAQQGDEVAREILSEAGRALGELAVSVIHKLGFETRSFRVACVGSVFRAGEVVIEPLRRAVLDAAPRAEVGPPLNSPAVGAAKLARRGVAEAHR